MTENKLVKPYLEYEVRKFFSLGCEASELRAFESTVDQLLALLRLKHEELEARHALIQFYNTQIYEIDKEFFAIQTRQRTLDQELRPVLSRLQRFRIDMGMLTSVGLGFDQVAKPKPVHRYEELDESEKLDVFRVLCPDWFKGVGGITTASPAAQQLEPRLHTLIRQMQDPKTIDRILTSGKAHDMKLRICHPDYLKAKSTGPKKFRVGADESNGAAKKDKASHKKPPMEKMRALDGQWLEDLFGQV